MKPIVKAMRDASHSESTSCENSSEAIAAIRVSFGSVHRVAFSGGSTFRLAKGLKRYYFELVLRVVVEMRSSPVSFGSPMASTSLPV